MPLTDPQRIEADRQHPRIVALWRGLIALRSTVSFMNTGAHPDDETSAMLAALRFRDGVDISYACSTRGEGGQNNIGQERGAALGTLRTAEMEAACDRLDLRMYWLSASVDDPITDFGFSKSGQETLDIWGRDRTLARFVRILRRERPDIICPTFLDVPGQHGHHRAMTEAAHQVMDLAADPSFDGCDLPVWQVKKLYLPAWSGAGQAYDDDLPPPPATLVVPASDHDPVTGHSFARIGQQSRVMHATQGMGRWVEPGGETDFPLHLARSFVAEPDHALGAGLQQTLRDLGLPAAQDACDAAIAAFPDADAVRQHACRALALLQQARPDVKPEAVHKISRKIQQLSLVIMTSAGVDARMRIDADVLHPGDATTWHVAAHAQSGALDAAPVWPVGWTAQGDRLTLAQDAQLSDPYPDTYLPGQPSAPCLAVALGCDGVTTVARFAAETMPVVLPARAAQVAPLAAIINLAADQRAIALELAEVVPQAAQPGLAAPPDWQVQRGETGFRVTAPDTVSTGLYELSVLLDGEQAQSVGQIAASHVSARALATPAIAKVRVIDAALPDVRVGYIGGGHDQVGHWLAAMGLAVTDLSDQDLTDAALAACDTLVVGIFAMRFHEGLAIALPRIHQWVHDGGTLLTLYHRPWDNWDALNTAPYRLEIGQPSLRWRVTDASAPVLHLVPDHPLLQAPNQITRADWDGWTKERGLYFAKDWDAAYAPLLAMHDTGEAPLKGALLAADYGAGRHVHTALILHHQLDCLTPGAFRLLANLVAKRS